MMIVVAHLKLSGFFRLVAGWALTRAHSARVLLAAVVVTAGTLSAFLVNDAVCLVMAPLVIEVTRALRRNPVPYLLALAMAANVGSTATITGNPQNMIIGAISHIPYTAFAAVLAPVAAAGLVLVTAVILAVWWSEFRDPERLAAAPPPARVHRPQMIKAVLVTGGVVVLFFAGVPVAKAAILGGALLLVTRAIKARKVYREIDGALLHDVRRLVRGGGGRREGAAEPRCGRGRARPAPRRRLGLDRRHRGPLEHHQQRAGRAGAQAVRRRPSRRAARLAHDRHELDACRQFHPGRIGRQPDRGGARPPGRDRDSRSSPIAGPASR